MGNKNKPHRLANAVHDLGTYFLNVFGTVDGRQEGRELEILECSLRWYPYICGLLSSNIVFHTNLSSIAWFSHSHCRVVDLSCIDSGHSTEPA